MSVFDNPLVTRVVCTPTYLNTYSINSVSGESLASIQHLALFFINYSKQRNRVFTFSIIDPTNLNPQTMVFVGFTAGFIPPGVRQVFGPEGLPFDERSFGRVTANLLGIYYADRPIVFNLILNKFVPEMSNAATVAMSRSFMPTNPSINGELDANLQVKFTVQGKEYLVSPQPEHLKFFALDSSFQNATLHLNKYLVNGSAIIALPHGSTLPIGATIDPNSMVLRGTDSEDLCLVVDGIPFAIEDSLASLDQSTFTLSWWSKANPVSRIQKNTTDQKFAPGKGKPGSFAFFEPLSSALEVFGSVFSDDQLMLMISFRELAPLGTTHRWTGVNSQDITNRGTNISDKMTSISDVLRVGDLFDNMNQGGFLLLNFTSPIVMNKAIAPAGFEQVTDVQIKVASTFNSLLVPQIITCGDDESAELISEGLLAGIIVGSVSLVIATGLVCLAVSNVSKR